MSMERSRNKGGTKRNRNILDVILYKWYRFRAVIIERKLDRAEKRVDRIDDKRWEIDSAREVYGVRIGAEKKKKGLSPDFYRRFRSLHVYNVYAAKDGKHATAVIYKDPPTTMTIDLQQKRYENFKNMFESALPTEPEGKVFFGETEISEENLEKLKKLAVEKQTEEQWSNIPGKRSVKKEDKR